MNDLLENQKSAQVSYLQNWIPKLRSINKSPMEIRKILLIENGRGPLPLGASSVETLIDELLKTSKNGHPAPAEVISPRTLGMAAFHGLAGDIVRVIEPNTEADPAGLLLQFLTVFGSVVGECPHVVADADRHPARLFVSLVGDTASGRKGTSWGHIRRMFDAIAPKWTANNIKSGLSSGEGLIYNVRDGDDGPPDKARDLGVMDKRLLVFEPELASVLKSFSRNGNTLSPVLRQAWDTGHLSTLTKNSPLKTLSSHVSLISHITKEELTRLLAETEMANGLGNRFLWVSVRRSKLLPDGGKVPKDRLPLDDIKAALESGELRGEIVRTTAMSALWREVYPRLTSGGVGLVGALLARGAAQVLRLSLIYALLDKAEMIDRPHLEAALAVWAYCEGSVREIFGTSLGNTVADTLIRSMGPDGLTLSEGYEVFSNHISARELMGGFRALESFGLVKAEREATGGRPVLRWVRVSELSEESERREPSK